MNVGRRDPLGDVVGEARSHEIGLRSGFVRGLMLLGPSPPRLLERSGIFQRHSHEGQTLAGWIGSTNGCWIGALRFDNREAADVLDPAQDIVASGNGRNR